MLLIGLPNWKETNVWDPAKCKYMSWLKMPRNAENIPMDKWNQNGIVSGLQLHGPIFNADDAEKLASYLTLRPTIENVSFHCFALIITPRLIDICSYLRILDLGCNSIDSWNVPRIAAMLCTTLTLTLLCLRSTGINNEGAKAIGDALGINDTLTHLDLSYNCIGDAGARAIAMGLRENVSLSRLEMIGNPIPTVVLFEEMLLHNLTLTSLSLQYKNTPGHLQLYDPNELNAIYQKLDRNKELTFRRLCCCRTLLIAFLGVRKLHRGNSGIWTNTPREILLMIGKMIWDKRHHFPCYTFRYPPRTNTSLPIIVDNCRRPTLHTFRYHSSKKNEIILIAL